jgi:predicted transcriptional regulator
LIALSNRLQNLKDRILRLRLRTSEVAEMAGVDESTLHRSFHGHTDPLNSTVDKIEAAIAAEEDRLRRALATTQSGAAA